MKKYVGTKIIKAESMSRHDYLRKIKGESMPHSDEEHNKDGYLVEYTGGYQSWSPKDVFEISYREISEAEYELLK